MEALAEIKQTLSLYSNDVTRVSRHLKNLASITKSHFRNEEKYIKETNHIYRKEGKVINIRDTYEEHRMTHLRLEKELDEIILDPESGWLNARLENWLLPHLLEDKDVLFCGKEY